MAARTVSQDLSTRSKDRLSTQEWVKIGLVTAIVAIAFVLVSQAAALSIWPQAAAFRPLDSYPRSAIFTLVPAIVATVLFARLAAVSRTPAASFLKVAVLVLLLSFVPDYLLPDLNKTFLASSIAAFLHLVAGIVITLGILTGYKRARTVVRS